MKRDQQGGKPSAKQNAKPGAKKNTKAAVAKNAKTDPTQNANTGAKPEKMKRKDYEAELERLHKELVKLQMWVVANELKVCIVFEGRDTAGKGGTIKAITERVSPRVFRVVALPAPTEREKTQMYMQRYIQHMPSGGEVVIFDRSWYNRAGVERVMGFASGDSVQTFLDNVAKFERWVTDSGVILIKLWLEIGKEEQERRFLKRIDDPMRQWKLSGMDLESFPKWYAYSRARDEMFAASDHEAAPWFVLPSDDKKRARLNGISHILARVPYETIEHDRPKLPKRSKKGAYDDKLDPEKVRFVRAAY